jgi:hypothetical protein
VFFCPAELFQGIRMRFFASVNGWVHKKNLNVCDERYFFADQVLCGHALLMQCRVYYEAV